MKIKVRAYGELTTLLGNETVVELEADAKLKDLVSRLAEKSGTSKRRLLGSYDAAEPELIILLNGRNIHALEKLQTPLRDGDIIVLLPPLVGG
jgi:molybdopterin synthase sulfur carrier subunit